MEISPKTDFGSFLLSRDSDNPRVICITKEGATLYSFDLLATPKPKDEEWIPVGQRGTHSHRKKISFNPSLLKENSTKNVDPTNKYSILGDTGEENGKGAKVLASNSKQTPSTKRVSGTEGAQSQSDSTAGSSEEGLAGSEEHVNPKERIGVKKSHMKERRWK